jgi:hypothetical protein
MATATLTLPDGKSATLTFPDDATPDEIKAKAMAAKAQYMAAHPKTVQLQQEMPDKPVVPTVAALTDDKETFREEVAEVGKGVLDIGSTVVTGAVGEIAGGIAGLAGILLPGEENQGTRWKDATASAITKDLWSDQANKWVAGTGEFIKKHGIDKAAAKAGNVSRDAILAVSGGNPVIATAIETGLRAIPEIALGWAPKASSVKTLLKIRKDRDVLKTRYNDMVKSAEKAGYKLSNDELPASVVRVAENLAPEKHAAANMDEVAESVKKAHKQMGEDINDLYETARAKKGTMASKPFNALASEMEQDFFKRGFDVAKMPTLQGVLADLKNPSRVLPPSAKPPKPKLNPFTGEPMPVKAKNPRTIELQTLDIIEQRISKAIKGKKRGDYTAEDAALLDLRTAMRQKLDEMFDADAVKGDPAAKEAWREARGASAKKKRLFNTDRTIRNMVQQDESPEQVYRWLMGASAMGAKKQSAATVTRLKEILGDNHPSLTLIRQAAVRDVVMPAFEDVPNFPKLIRNIDRLANDNATLVKELNIPMKELQMLKRAAHAATKTHKELELLNRGWFLKTVNRVVFGHQIARAGAVVQFAHRLTDSVFRTGALRKEELIRHMMDLDTTQPLVTPKGPLWTEIVVRGAAVDALDDREESFADQDTADE